MKKDNKQNAPLVNIGTASMIVILIGLCFAVLAALAVSSAKNDYNMSKEMAEHNRDYYVANNKAVDIMIDPSKYETKEGDVAFSVSINDNQDLVVNATKQSDDTYEITKWQVVNIGSWDGDESLPVLK